jgi:ankyrin repeat protein
MLDRIRDGRTDLVADYLAAGHRATSSDPDGVSLIQWCAYYGDVAAVKLLLGKGASLAALGEDLGLNAAAFHGHWKLCQFLLESGADANRPLPDTGETPLHAALCKAGSDAHELVVQVLLEAGADPNRATKPGVETGAFMRDCRTYGETPLHRAAAFAGLETIERLLEAGAKLDAKDTNGDSPLSWASWHLRPDSVLRKLCYGAFSIHPDRQTMARSLLGRPR